MSRPTPETDAAEWNWYDDCTPANEMIVPAALAKKLERERDEAQERIERQKLEINRLNGATNHAGGTPLKIALRERDEWAAMCGRYKQERDEAHKIAEQAIEDLAWFNETNSQRLRTELENEMKWHHRTHKELIEAQCKLLDIEYDKLKS